jgi:hypothetical protein
MDSKEFHDRSASVLLKRHAVAAEGRLPVHPCSIGGTRPAGGKPIGREITDRKFCWMTSLCGSWEDYPRRGGPRCGAYFAALPRTGHGICPSRTGEQPEAFRRCRPARTWTASAMLGTMPPPGMRARVRRSGLGGLGRRRVRHPTACHHAILRFDAGRGAAHPLRAG